MNELCVIPTRAICDRELPGSALRLLGYLSSMTDENGVCWPSSSTVSDAIGLANTTILRNKQMLEQMGYIKSVPRYRSNGSQTSSACQVLYDTELPAEVLADIDPKKLRKAIPKAALRPSAAFLVWYAEYPRRTSRGAAWRAYGKAVGGGATHDVLLEGAKSYARLCKKKETDERYIPHPATWLNSEKWLDDDVKNFAPSESAGDLAPEAL